MIGSAWPFLVGELTCQVDSGNERDLRLLTSNTRFVRVRSFLEGRFLIKRQRKLEAKAGL